MIVNNYDYVTRRTTKKEGKATYRSWWLIKHTESNVGYLQIDKIMIPERFVGKKIRLKIEEVKE